MVFSNYAVLTGNGILGLKKGGGKGPRGKLPIEGRLSLALLHGAPLRV